MNKTLTIAAAVALVLAGTGLAVAKSGGQRGGAMPTFEELDADGSGEITVEDLAQAREARFSDMDTNGDGAVSEEEFVAAAAERSTERAAEMFARLDADGDGSLSRDALEARGGRGGNGERMISRLDTDDSGGVSAEEFEAAKERFAKRGKKRGERGDK